MAAITTRNSNSRSSLLIFCTFFRLRSRVLPWLRGTIWRKPRSLAYVGANLRTLQITEVTRLRNRPETRSLGSGMGLIVDLEHVFDGELSVALGCGKALVTEHLLNGAQIGTFFQHVGSESMTKSVRVNVRRQSPG